MRIEQLELHNFRNISHIHLTELTHPCIVLQGDNAQGKSNILEAMYMAATGRSFRQATARQMLRQGTETGQISAVCQRRAVRHQVEVNLRPSGRGLKVDGRQLRQVTQLLDMLNLVAFFPDDLRIAKGGPEERRRFLDRATANATAGFADAAISYARALKARNALLRGNGAVDRGVLAAYDAQLVRFGVPLHDGRTQLLARLLPLAQQIIAGLLPESTGLEVRLDSGFAAHPDDLAAALAASYPKDRARGMTCVGPHRADLLASLSGADIRQYASQGQQRAVVLALKLAEVQLLAQALDGPPILLLDDVSSELDATRSRLLFAAVARLGCQVWVSTTGAVDLPISGPASRFEIVAGTCRRIG